MDDTLTKGVISNRTEHWREVDNRHHLHPFTTHKELRAQGVKVITHADGVYLYDSEGNRLLDGMAGLWCTNIGYGNEEVAEAGYEALKTLPYYNTFFQTTHPYVTDLCEMLAELTPEGLDNFFFANSGSEANDTAVKMIRYYWNLMDRPEKKFILSRKDGYHGTTIAAASVSGLTPMHPQFDLPIAGVEHVSPAPYWYGEAGEMTPEEFTDHIIQATEAKILEIGADRIGAFLGEPAQGAAGMRTPPPGYWPRINALCKKYDILLWADEVICGFGRTGKWFGCDTYGIEPDLITMAKGMSSGYQPISALALGPRMNDAITADNNEMVHGFTYSGHPVACAVSLKNIEILKRLDLVGDAGRKGADTFQAGIQTLADHPLVGEVRGVGFLGAIELIKDQGSRGRFDNSLGVGGRCRDHSVANGLIMRACGDTMVLSPPLIINEAEVAELVEKARIAIDATERDLKSDGYI